MNADTSSPEVVVYTSLRGLAGAVVTPLALLLLGLGSLVAVGTAPLPVALALLGGALSAVTVLDYPRHTVFHGAGVTRVCLARRHRLPWARLVAIERTLPTTGASMRNLVDRGAPAQVSGGLVARGGRRRRWLLTDRIESNLEYDRLRELMRRLDVPTVLRAPRPHDGVTPSDIYRPRRQGTDGLGKR